jgi:hypothetical protein
LPRRLILRPNRLDRKAVDGWLKVVCKPCETRASLPLDAIRRPRDTPIWKQEAAAQMPVVLFAAGAHDPTDEREVDRAVCLGASG